MGQAGIVPHRLNMAVNVIDHTQELKTGTVRCGGSAANRLTIPEMNLATRLGADAIPLALLWRSGQERVLSRVLRWYTLRPARAAHGACLHGL